MKNIFTGLFLLLCSISNAQYYYKDLIGAKEMNDMIRLYIEHKVMSVTATGFDGDGRRNTDFSEIHEFNPAQNVLKIGSRNKTDIRNQYYRFDKNGLITSISDTVSGMVSQTVYAYDAENRLVSLKNAVTDRDDSIFLNEVHQWFYNVQGKPERMYRVVNNTDTTDVRFTLDENGNVIEEWPFIKKLSREKTLYYYDQKNRLSDIVRYNVAAKKLLPDFMFEYSDKDQVIQKITTTTIMGLGYLIWRYVYDDKGLKTKEASFNRDKVMTGKIEYTYRFR